MSKPLDPIAVAADIGNATTTVITPAGTVFFPSFVATFGVGAYAGLSKIATTRHHLTRGTRHAIVGDGALGMPGADTLLAEYDAADAWRRYVEPASLDCLLAAVCAAYPTIDTLAIDLAIGAPASIAASHGEAIAAAYRGRHEVSYNGHRRVIAVARAAVYGEGVEAWRLLPPAGRVGRVALHDVGGRTWSVSLYRDGALLAAPRVYDLGVDRLLAAVSGVSSEPAARWALMTELRSGGKGTAALRKELATQADAALALIERKVPGLLKADRHVIVGGAAALIAPALQARYGSAPVVLGGATPEQSNARAYALAARGEAVAP